MKDYQIKAALMAKNIRQSQIAMEQNVSRATVCQVISRRAKSCRIRQAIATAIGRPVSEVFPDNQPSTKEAV